jgi:hypothetical protein
MLRNSFNLKILNFGFSFSELISLILHIFMIYYFVYGKYNIINKNEIKWNKLCRGLGLG